MAKSLLMFWGYLSYRTEESLKMLILSNKVIYLVTVGMTIVVKNEITDSLYVWLLLGLFLLFLSLLGHSNVKEY